jgi:hypothetical protein
VQAGHDPPAVAQAGMLGNGMCTRPVELEEEAALERRSVVLVHIDILSGAMPRSWNVTPGMRGNLGVPTNGWVRSRAGAHRCWSWRSPT